MAETSKDESTIGFELAESDPPFNAQQELPSIKARAQRIRWQLAMRDDVILGDQPGMTNFPAQWSQVTGEQSEIQ